MRRVLLVVVTFLSVIVVSPAQAAPGPSTPVVWVFGHSIPAGVGASVGHSWPERLAQLEAGANQPVDLHVFAVGGSVLHDPAGVTGTIGAQVDAALLANPGVVPDRVLIDAGTNDLVSHDSTTLALSMWAAIGIDVALEARGVKAEWLPILPMGYGSSHPDNWLGSLNARRDSWNGWLTAMAGYNAMKVINLDGAIGQFPVPAWLEADGLHPTDAAALLIADRVAS